MSKYTEWIKEMLDYGTGAMTKTLGLSLLFVLIIIALSLIPGIPIMIYLHYRNEKASKPGFMQRGKVK